LLNGEPRKAEKVFEEVYADHPKDVFATKACEEMLGIAALRKDLERQVELWTNLVFKTSKTKRTPGYASQLAKHHFRDSEFTKGVEVVQSCYKKEDGKFIESVFGNGNAITSELFKSDASKPRAEKLGDEVIAFLEERLPTDLSDKKTQEQAHLLLGWVTNVHMTLDRDKKVIASFERNGKLLGIDDNLLGGIAAWHKKKDRREQARSTYGRYEDKVNGRRAIAGSFREEKKYEEAVRHYLTLIGLDKEREATWQNDVVGTWREAHQWDKAIATYRELLKVDPDRHSNWYWGIAECYEKKSQFSQAIQAYRQTDNYPEGYFRMAECNRHLKKWTEGLVLLNQAKAEKKVADRAQYRIAQFYEMAGQKEKCIKSFQMTCKLYPRSGYASRAHAHLQDEYGISVTLGGAKD
jgi:tetratricopeptide (TPR) repeat protein